jgi:cytoskeletal protein CcmA (bactofilin family)
MWNNKQQNDFPSSSPAQAPAAPGASFNPNPAARPTPPTAKNLSCLGASLEIKGQVSGDEDLQVDGKITGPVSLGGQKVTVGRTGQLNSEVSAREIVVYGKVTGNLRARDRVEIKKDGSVVGDITTARISVEDGADLKGRIEIERAKHNVGTEADHEEVPVGAAAN